MSITWTVGERVIWLSRFDFDESVICVGAEITRADAEIIGVAHGRVLIRVLDRIARHAEALVDRWVEPESLRRKVSREGQTG